MAAPPGPEPVAIGDHPKLVAFGKYLLLERIAIGGMAEVWLGKTIQDDGSVSDLLAIKRLLSKFGEDDEFLTMFVDEARIVGQLEHPGVVPIHELGRHGSSMYIAMEFVWGRDLLGILRRLRELGRSFEPETVAYIGSRLAETLHYAHTAIDREGKPLSVVHRDVSPQNVLVSFDGKVKLIDFGIAKAATRSTRTQAGTLKGKVGYMSPEQVQGGTVDHRSDQFALGTCLYEMLTGRPLFTRPNNYDSMALVREAEVPPLLSVAPECPPRLAEIVHRALSKDPEQRFPTSHELHKALTLFLADADPGYERFTLVTWLRSLFKEEMAEEKRRLDALDLIARPAIAPVPKRRANASTRLEIGAYDLFDDDDDAETRVFDESPLSKLEIDVRPVGPYEVFFQKEELVRVGEAAPPSARPLKATFRPGRAGASESWRPPRTDLAELGPYRRVTARDSDPDARRAPPSGSIALGAANRPERATAPDRPTEPSVMLSPDLASDLTFASADITQKQEALTGFDDLVEPKKPAGDVALDPAEINSQLIRAMLPLGKDEQRPGVREVGDVAAEQERRAQRRRAERTWRRRRDLALFALAAVLMLVVGAAGTYWWLTSGIVR